MPHTEPAVNVVLAELLRPMLPRAEVRAENTGVLATNRLSQPDILVTAPGRGPVAIEAEFMPANTVEKDALSRLGQTVADGAREIEAVIAVRYPAELRDAPPNVTPSLRAAKLTFAVYTLGGSHNRPLDVRFPESGWLDMGIGGGNPMILKTRMRVLPI